MIAAVVLLITPEVALFGRRTTGATALCTWLPAVPSATETLVKNVRVPE
jgi:hypothetical protein